MKKLIVSFIIMLAGISIYAQESDTTKIKLGDTKIIIIGKDADKDIKSKKDKLEKGKAEFEKMKSEKQSLLDDQKKELDDMKKELDAQKDELGKQKLEQNLQKKEQNLSELEKELQALEKGIDDIDKELNEESESDIDWDNDKEKDFKSNHKDKFDWNFNDDWHSNWDHLSPFGKGKKFNGHWAGIDLGLNNYVDKDLNLTLSPENRNFELNAGGSWVFALNFLQFNIPFGRKLGLVSGMGSRWNNYHFSNNVNVYEDVNGIMVAETDLEKSYNKNTMNTWNFDVPLLFEFQLPFSDKKPSAFFSFGVVGSAKVLSWGKQKYYINGDRYKSNKRSDYLMNTFSYGFTARVGYKGLKLFVNYDAVPLFQKDRGPELFPVSVGLSLISF